MAKNKISAVINTLNESANIYDCLDSVKFADEIIVVDMESDDNTKEIAKEFTDKIYDHPRVGYVEPARNFAISKAVGDWILLVDADERIPRSLSQRLIDIAQKNEADFVRIPRKNTIFGQWIQHSRWWPDHNIRFFKKGSVEWQDEIHSIPVTYGNGINLPSDADFAITHFHYRNIDEYIERSLRYSRQQAKELLKSGYKFDPKDIITKPLSEFISRFFAGEGYKDGLHGLVLSVLQAFSILLIYLRIWQDEDYKSISGSQMAPIWKESFKEKAKEMKYWLLTESLHSERSKVKKFVYKVARKFTK